MSKIAVTKAIVNFAVGAGTTKVVAGIIRNNTNPKNIYDTVTITSSAVVVGMMASDATKEYSGAKIDEAVNAWNNFKNKKKS